MGEDSKIGRGLENSFFRMDNKLESIIGQIKVARSQEEVDKFVRVVVTGMPDFAGRAYEAQAEWKRVHRLEAPKFGKTKKR